MNDSVVISHIRAERVQKYNGMLRRTQKFSELYDDCANICVVDVLVEIGETARA